ncbi:protein TadG [Vibrio ponticus]|nr:protein TadG [Vibrio ponticus]
MCDKIREHLDGLTASNGDPVTSRISVIGFDYDVSSNKGLQTCAGSDNVFKAQNKNEILNKILELISEEIGHLK